MTTRTAPLQPILAAPPNTTSSGMEQRNLVVLQRLDIGTFSEVFAVKSIFDSKKYAIKKMSVGEFLKLTKHTGAAGAFELFKRLMREVLIMAQLSENPNIVAYLEAW